MVELRFVSLLPLFVSFFFFLIIKSSDNDIKYRVNVVLIGATGDLAKRYLWKGFFNLYLSRKQRTTFRFYGAARLANEKGDVALEEILKTSIKCSDDSCERKKAEFLKLCSYFRLKSEKDYEQLQDILELEARLEQSTEETGRLFYLSVPPFAYEDISRHINSKCRPKEGKAWLRAVFEKPFGSDFQTAQELSEKLSKYWKEEEIYRIDHYLGKSGVRQITQFRNKNRFTYEKIWNKDFIEQVNIVVKEKGDVEGRMAYYDHYGVIRDVFQNHLTELLVLIASDLPEDHSEITMNNSKKTELLKVLRIIPMQDAIFGQYNQYNAQLKEDISKTDADYDSNTPTFAATLVHVDNKRWFGVPFVLMSGKSLDSRLAYVQVQFKSSTFCVGDDFMVEYPSINCKPRELVFHIQGGDLEHPATIVSRSLPKVNLPNGWKNITPDIIGSSLLQGNKVIIEPPSDDAYSSLIQDVFFGNKGMFVEKNDLLLSWKVWTPLLEMSAVISPRLYTPGKVEELDFEIVKGKIKFITDKVVNECKGSKPVSYSEHQATLRSRKHSFHGNKLISGSTVDVVQKLANDITVAAQLKVHSNGIFHLALSGGSTPQQLFQVMAYSMIAFPWQHTHVWVVDERCVSLTHNQSNFKNIYENFLKFVNIPFVNIHPMPVDIAGRLCHKEDKTDLLYEHLLRYHLENCSLDFVVLGVGNDGHTASLFPNQSSLRSARWVELTNNNHLRGASNRMTMTLVVLNRAKEIAVLILGENKRAIVSKLSGSGVDVDSLPITGVKPENGMFSWYIDDSALQD